MNLRTSVSFIADFPDDSEADDDGWITVQPGRNILEALREMLLRRGYDAEEPENAHDHGWDLYVRRGSLRAWFEIQYLGEHSLLQSDDISSILTKLLGRSRRPYADLLMTVHEELAKDGRFHELLWHYRWELMEPDRRGGATPSPVIQGARS